MSVVFAKLSQLALMTGVCLAVFGGNFAEAQSQSRGMAPAQPAAQARVVSSANAVPSANAGARSAVTMDGYCPVCIIDMKQWVKGDPSHQVQHDGKTYYFPGAKQKDMFLANPNKYVPALGGDCTVCLTEKQARKPGSVRFSALSNGRLYLFPSDMQKKMFVSNPDRYVNSDVAMGGKCVVCKAEMGKDVQGLPEFSTLHAGMRYWFPSEKQRQMFLTNPAKYTGATAPMAAGSGKK